MNQFTEVMKKHSDEKLIDMITNHKDDYVPEAIEAIKAEIISRGLGDKIEPDRSHYKDPKSVFDIAIREIIEMEK